jgi:SAM-dependent MidA family methyltransferase
MEILTNSEALQHCKLLSNLIDESIKKNQDWLPFSHFMDLALYSPHFGYYTSGTFKFGQSGDFVTAPEISSLFGATLGKTIAPLIDFFKGKTRPSCILEFGAGSGKLCQDILIYLKEIEQLPAQYFILDVSPELIQRQQESILPFLKEHDINTSVEWVEDMPQDFQGIVLANEVLDAMPFDLVIFKNGRWFYRGVKINPKSHSPSFSDHWLWEDGPLVPMELLPRYLQQDNQFPENYITEIHPRAHAWIKMVAEKLTEGILIAVDYGFPEHEYYHPQRNQGTHVAHHQHHAIPDMFYLPGLCDITTHVEWSAINRTAAQSGMGLIHYQSQGAYLLAAGIGDIFLEKMNPSDSKNYISATSAFQKLISEAEMGELFKIAAWNKNLSGNIDFENLCASLPGFTNRQRLLSLEP